MQAADCHLKGEETRGTPRLLVSAGTFLGEITSSSLYKSGPSLAAFCVFNRQVCVSNPAVLSGTLY